MDKVLVFGCSHTYGDGIGGRPEKPWEQHSTNSWPYHMFNKNEIVNYSRSGNSNDMISLNLIRNVNKAKLVLIMFTYPERTHIIRKGYNFIASHNSSQAVSDSGNENWVAKQINDKYTTKNKNLVIENYDDSYLEIKMLMNILFCQNYLKNKNIPYCFTMVNNREAVKMGGSLQSYRDSIVNEIDWKKFYFVDGKYGFSDYATFTKADLSSDGVHWGSEYHKTFGKLMKKYIETNNENMLL